MKMHICHRLTDPSIVPFDVLYFQDSFIMNYVFRKMRLANALQVTQNALHD